MTKSIRQPYKTTPIILIGTEQVKLAHARLDNAPIDPDRPLEFLIRERVKLRGQDANARYWAGPLRDVAEQAWVNGRQYSAEVWHEHMKRSHLVEADDPDLPDLVKNSETWRKWDYTPAGDRVLVGTTTQLTVKGFAQYLEQVCADAANMGVQLSVSPKEGRE